MDNLFISLCLIGITASIWVVPSVYTIAATLLLSVYAAHLGIIDVSATIIIVIMAIAGYNFVHRDSQNGMLRIIILLLVFWALFSEANSGHVLLWTSYVQLVAIQKAIVIKLNFEKILTALLLGAYLIRPKFSIKYWLRIFNSALTMLILVYVLLLLPLFVILNVFSDLNLGDIHLFNLFTNLFLISFTEEVLFRLIIQNWLYQLVKIKFGAAARWLPIVAVSIIYGLFHAKFGYFIVLLTIFVGAAYGYIYQKSGKIEAAILVHFALRLTFCLFVAFVGRELHIPMNIS